MTLAARPLPELDPHDPGPAVHHVDPLLSLSLSPPLASPLALFVVLAFIRPSLSYLPCRHRLSSLSSSLLAIPRIAHIPAHPSLMLIYVTGYS